MNTETAKEIVKSLMESRFYFELNLRERLNLVLHVLRAMEDRPLMGAALAVK